MSVMRTTYIVIAAITLLFLMSSWNTILDGTTRLIRFRTTTNSKFVDLGALEDNVPWSIIKQTYVINLPSAVARMNFVSSQLKILDIAFERFNAVEKHRILEIYNRTTVPKDMSELLDARFRADPECFLATRNITLCPEISHYTAAVAFSHMNVWLHAIDSVKENRREDGAILIFEDDVIVSKNFKQITSALVGTLNKIDPNWIILGLGYSANHIPSAKIPFVLDRNLGFGCLHGYILRNIHAAQLMFDVLNTPSVGINDHVWWKLVQTTKYTSYVYAPNDIVNQLCRGENDHKNGCVHSAIKPF